MSKISRKRWWHGAIGLIAAYALVLQTLLASSIAAQAAAQGDALYSGSFFVICTSHDSAAAADDGGGPVKPVTHCPICTLSIFAAAKLSDPVLLPNAPPSWHRIPVAQTTLVLGQYATRPPSRGPPTIV
jgi:hypothetical protein